jgi:hypothetical protein
MSVKLMAGILLSGAVACGTAFAQSDAKKSGKKSDGGGKTVSLPLKAQNKSGESGTVKLTPMGDQTKVEVSLRGAPKGVAQPAHIHEGSCAKLDPKPKYPLSNVVDGKSSSEVPAKMEELMGGAMAVNVHKSGDDIKTYVACADLKGKGKGKGKS